MKQKPQIKKDRTVWLAPGLEAPPGVRIPPVEGRDYEFLPNDDDALKIRILRNDYRGIVYVYEYVALIPPPVPIPKDEFDDVDAQYNMVEEEDQSARLKFDYVILENPEEWITKHVVEFDTLVGDILSQVLIDAASNPESKYSMVSKNDEGKITALKPIKKKTIGSNVTSLPVRTAPTLQGFFRRVSKFFFGG